MSMHTEEEPPTPSAPSAAANIVIARDSSNQDVTTASRIPVDSNGISLLRGWLGLHLSVVQKFWWQIPF
jgi:hypothetical protein